MKIIQFIQAAAALVLMAAASGMAATHRCTDAQGSVSFSDRPCPEGQRTETLPNSKLRPEQAQEWICSRKERPPINKQEAPTEAQQESLKSVLYPLAYTKVDMSLHSMPSGAIHVCFVSRTNGEPQEIIVNRAGRVFHKNGNAAPAWVNDPASPLEQLSRCSAQASDCFGHHPSANSVDRCVEALPLCKPGSDAAHCCPARCVERYQAARATGRGPLTSFQEAFFGGKNGCAAE